MTARTWNLFAIRRAMGGRWRYYAPFAKSADWLRVTCGNRGEVVAATLTEASTGSFYGFVTPGDGKLELVEFGWRRFEYQFPTGSAVFAVHTGGEVVRLAVSEA